MSPPFVSFPLFHKSALRKSIDPLIDYRRFLADLKENGTSSLSTIKAPQALQDFFVDHVVTMTSVNGGCPEKAEVQELFKRIMRKAKPCYSSLVLALFYLDRLWRKLSQQEPTDLAKSHFARDGLGEMIAAFILADKYLFDIALANCEWAKVSHVHDLSQVNAFEREFLYLLDYNIQFSEDSFSDFVSFLEVSLTIRQHKMQAFADYPLTYTDLCILNKPLTSDHANALHLTSRPSQSTLSLLRFMMVCCVAYCAVMFTVSAAVNNCVPQTEVAKEASPASASPSVTAVVPHPVLSRTQRLTKSESFSGLPSKASPTSASIIKDRKRSDSGLREANPWFYSTLGNVKS